MVNTRTLSSNAHEPMVCILCIYNSFVNFITSARSVAVEWVDKYDGHCKKRNIFLDEAIYHPVDGYCLRKDEATRVSYVLIMQYGTEEISYPV